MAFKEMFNKLWPLSKLVVADDEGTATNRLDLITRLLTADPKTLQELLMSSQFHHRPFHTSELDPTDELVPVKSPSPPPSPPGEYGVLEESSAEDVGGDVIDSNDGDGSNTDSAPMPVDPSAE